jgi:hypothetical protein
MQRAKHGMVSPAPTSLALSSSSCLGTRWPRANRTLYRVSEYFRGPIIVIIMLCEEPRRIRVSRIRCYSFAPARSPEWRERGTGIVRRVVWFLPLGERPILLGIDTQASIHSSLE